MVERIVPPERRAWLRGMAGELAHVPSAEQAHWTVGVAWAGLRLAAVEGVPVRTGVMLLMTAYLIWWDWHTVDSARVIAVLLLGAAALSAWQPRARLQHGLVLGTCLLSAHLASEVTGLAHPFYRWKPLVWSDWLTIVAIAPPAMLAASIGALSRSGFSRPGSGHDRTAR